MVSPVSRSQDFTSPTLHRRCRECSSDLVWARLCRWVQPWWAQACLPPPSLSSREGCWGMPSAKASATAWRSRTQKGTSTDPPNDKNPGHRALRLLKQQPL